MASVAQVNDKLFRVLTEILKIEDISNIRSLSLEISIDHLPRLNIERTIIDSKKPKNTNYVVERSYIERFEESED